METGILSKSLYLLAATGVLVAMLAPVLFVPGKNFAYVVLYNGLFNVAAEPDGEGGLHSLGAALPHGGRAVHAYPRAGDTGARREASRPALASVELAPISGRTGRIGWQPRQNREAGACRVASGWGCLRRFLPSRGCRRRRWRSWQASCVRNAIAQVAS